MEKHIPQLDGFRAVAVLPVLAIHLWQFPQGYPILTRLFGGGWIGVDLFFVLSGFLITRILLSSKESPRYFSNFYARRSLRIFPLAYAVMIFVLGIRPLFSSDPTLIATAHDRLWYFLYASNILLAMKGWQFEMVGVTWSLAVEEQFYFAWPALMKWLSAERMKVVCIGLIIACPILRALLFPYIGWRWCFMTTPLRADAFAWGAVIALGGVEFFKRFAWPALLASIAIIAVALPMGLFVRETLWVSSIGYGLTGMGAAAALWLTIHAKHTILSSRPLRHIGMVSYGVYLLHRICAVEVSRFYHGTGLIGSIVFMLLAGAVTIGVATLSFRYFETPFLRLKDRFTSNSAAPVLATRGTTA